ncbi:exodeoxyribonuclease VII large subunit [Thermaurantimonas aggregans]|uniref:exodeoxyribonuclease VII large subunit n=1 Tax=Thermaurantimonas aggregans TaxID=2173829 RepID=UPI0023F16AEA|nr:exodeoxyribonuclease VII large subunit [Thermaurantimonas aggregans]MCX8147914.1 exodeoxyribonuclease VII large subunit [Thermaurantimonas aggregans]
MPERTGDKVIFSLLEVCNSIKKTLDTRYTSRFWVRAELMKLNYYKYSGHAYPDLVQKDDGRIVAQLKGIIWKSDLLKIQSAFQRNVNQPLTEGIEILFEASITYDAVHGLSLRIHQIDTTFSLGLIEKEKIQTIERLKNEGIFEANKNKSIRELPKNVAIISVETSKGWADFRQVIEPYISYYGLFFMMFPALLQGEGAVSTIREQLRRIQSVAKEFDMVMIIRGGGGEAGLSCYNNYDLCHDIATFPIPVLTGIGHSTNLTVAEMVAYYNAITPTALAEYYLNIFKTRESELVWTADSISKYTSLHIQQQKNHLNNLLTHLKNSSTRQLSSMKSAIEQTVENMHLSTQQVFQWHTSTLTEAIEKIQKNFVAYVSNQQKELQTITRIIRIQHPENILKKGYAYLLAGETAIKSVSQLFKNQEITLVLKDGRALGKILHVEKNTTNEQEKEETRTDN